MSARLSVTVITSVETRLNAATATISVRMMNIRRFSTCTAENQLRLVLVQSRTTTCGPSALLELGGDQRRPVQVLQAQLHAGRPFDAKELGGVFERDQREAAVVLVVAGVEGADDGERAQARHDPGRSDLAAGQDDRHLVALADRERARQLAAEDDAPRAGNEARQRRVAQLGGEVGDGRLFLRRDAADDDAAHVFAARDQRLRGDERRRADDLGIASAPGRRPGASRRSRRRRRRSARRGRSPTASGRALPSGSRSSPTAR